MSAVNFGSSLNDCEAVSVCPLLAAVLLFLVTDMQM